MVLFQGFLERSSTAFRSNKVQSKKTTVISISTISMKERKHNIFYVIKLGIHSQDPLTSFFHMSDAPNTTGSGERK